MRLSLGSSSFRPQYKGGFAHHSTALSSVLQTIVYIAYLAFHDGGLICKQVTKEKPVTMATLRKMQEGIKCHYFTTTHNMP